MARRHFATLPEAPRETGTVVVKTPGGALADVSLTENGSAISGSTLTVASGRVIPGFWGPPDGTGTLVLVMQAHGLDWDSTVLASDAAPVTPDTAAATSYDNTTSELTAEDVQAAIDELAASGPSGMVTACSEYAWAAVPAGYNTLDWDDATRTEVTPADGTLVTMANWVAPQINGPGAFRVELSAFWAGGGAATVHYTEFYDNGDSNVDIEIYGDTSLDGVFLPGASQMNTLIAAEASDFVVDAQSDGPDPFGFTLRVQITAWAA